MDAPVSPLYGSTITCAPALLLEFQTRGLVAKIPTAWRHPRRIPEGRRGASIGKGTILVLYPDLFDRSCIYCLQQSLEP